MFRLVIVGSKLVCRAAEWHTHLHSVMVWMGLLVVWGELALPKTATRNGNT